MSESGLKANRKKRFLREHSRCCFCGGEALTATWDHIPPRACFPPGYHPENFEFPACKRCNDATKSADQIFALYAVLVDFNVENFDHHLLMKLANGVRNNYTDELPNLNLPANVKRSRLNRWGLKKPAGVFLSDVPLAGIPVSFNKVAITIARKITCAMYYRHTKKILPLGYQMATGWLQIQNPDAESYIDFLNRNLNTFEQPSRSNIKEYGKRISYKFNYSEKDDVFGLAMQFGDGIMIWGLSVRPEVDMSGFQNISSWVVSPPDDPLAV